MEKLKRMGSVAMLAALAIGQTVAMAQPAPVTITYGPEITSVPTLSEWGMIIMAAVLAVVAVIAMRKGAGSKTVMSFAVAATVAFGGGAYSIKEALAIAIQPLSMTSPSGGTIETYSGQAPTPVVNNTSVRQKILSISPSEAVDNSGSGCVPGTTVLAPAASCTVLTIGFEPG